MKAARSHLLLGFMLASLAIPARSVAQLHLDVTPFGGGGRQSPVSAHLPVGAHALVLDTHTLLGVAAELSYGALPFALRVSGSRGFGAEVFTWEGSIATTTRRRGSTRRPVAFLPADLGVTKTHSRPYTSTDNPYSEAQFKTLKFPWYNHDHRHLGIGLMTPVMVHYGRAEQVRDKRASILTAAYAAHPERFVHGPPQPPALPEAVWINKPTAQEAAAHQLLIGHRLICVDRLRRPRSA